MHWPKRVAPCVCVLWFVMLAAGHTSITRAQPKFAEEEPLPEVPAARLEPPLPPTNTPTLSPPVGLPTAGPTQKAMPQVATLDYVDGSFLLRAFGDSMLLMPSGRMHIDTYAYAGNGVDDYRRANDTGLTTQIFFRRFVLEAGGLIGKYWFWWMGGSFVPLRLDASQALVSNAGVYDGIVGFKPLPILRIYFGQFNAPITMENVTSSRWLDLMERALLVRTIAIPENKAIGPVVWGETKHREFEYQFGGLSADGTIGRPSVDGHYNVMGRFLIRPIARREGALKQAHLGGSFRYGKRDRRFLIYDAPSMSTPGGYSYWSSSYGVGDARTVIIPDLRQAVVAAEGYLPFERWDIRSEFAWTHQERREALADDRTTSLRGGLLHGYGIYAQLSVWLAGTPRINGNPASPYGIIGPPQYKDRAPYALQLVLRGEAIRLNYDANSRFGSPGTLDPDTTRIRVNAYQAGVNFWATKHVRLTAEYSLYQFPGDPVEENQAVAPGVRAGTSPGAHFLSELSFRVGLAL